MPDMKKPIENPELVEALAALHQENTPQNQGRVLELVLHHAVLLTPAVVTPPPQAQQGGTAAADQKTAIQFQLIPRLHRLDRATQVLRPQAAADPAPSL